MCVRNGTGVAEGLRIPYARDMVVHLCNRRMKGERVCELCTEQRSRLERQNPPLTMAQIHDRMREFAMRANLAPDLAEFEAQVRYEWELEDDREKLRRWAQGGGTASPGVRFEPLDDDSPATGPIPPRQTSEEMTRQVARQMTQIIDKLNNREETNINMRGPRNNGAATLDEMREQLSGLIAAQQPKSEAEKNQEQILAVLRDLGGKVVKDDALVFEGTKMILPAAYAGRVPAAIRYLEAYQEQQETEFDFTRIFPYRPYDGANAFQVTLKNIFGTVGIGVATQTMFGEIPPRYQTINVGPNKTIQVPWGEVKLEALKATFTVGATRTPEGHLFALSVSAPRKFRAEIEAFFTAVEDTLKTASIYKGKAIQGTGLEPKFLDIRVDPDAVVYSAETLTQLRANLWTVIEHTDLLRQYGMPIKRAVLLEGPFGTGKTMAAGLTAQICAKNGWTFIECRPGRDDVHEVIATAQLYAPAVVQVEDIDTVAVGGDPEALSRILDTLDGISGKGKEIISLLTTNHAARIPKAVLRPGRISSVIHVGALDVEGLAKLVNYKIPADQRDVIDYQRVFDACDGYMPAYVTEVIDRAVRYAISERGEVRITTDDLVHAADGLRPQYELQQEAPEGVVDGGVDRAVEGLIRGVLHRTEIVDSDGDGMNQYLGVNDDSHGFLKNSR